MHNNIPFLTQKLAFMRVAPVLTMWYRLSARQIGKAMIPIAKDTVSLMTMKINIVRQPPMQIILFMKPDSTDRPQNRAAIA